jgi:hypothetical protein
LTEIFENIMMNTKLIFKVLEKIINKIKESESFLINAELTSISNYGTYFTLYHLIASFYLISIQNMINILSYKNENGLDLMIISEEDSSK